MADKAGNYFEREAEGYSAASKSGLWDWWRAKERAAIWKLLRPRRGESVLDAGCGAGYYSEHLLREGCRVTATDLSEGMVREAARRLGIPAFVGNLETLQTEERFDAVLCAGALEFVPKPGLAIASMARSVAPGGRLVLMLPHTGISARGYRMFHRRHGMEINLFNRTRLQKAATHADMRVTAWGSIGFNWVVRMER